MGVFEFIYSDLETIATASTLDKTRWSKYFNGQSIDEKTLNREAKILGMKPEDLLFAINARRRKRAIAS